MFKNTTERLDIYLTNNGLVESRTKASRLITAGKVLVNGLICKKSNTLIHKTDSITITESMLYVSRGGEKLAHALDMFDIDPSNSIVLDIGASTGGFSDCLLQKNAQLIYAVDVGSDQLHKSLRNNPKIINLEKTDIRKLESLPKKADLITIDVSFISLSHILSSLPRFLAHPESPIISLLKPQFETQRHNLNKHGVVKNTILLKEIIENAIERIETSGFFIEKMIESPILGKEGNREFLVLIRQGTKSISIISEISRMIDNKTNN